MHELGYEYLFEWPTPRLLHKDNQISFPIDIRLTNQTIIGPKYPPEILVNIDGGYHEGSDIQIGKTKNRDMTLIEFAKRRKIRYIVLKIEEVLEQTNESVRERILNLCEEFDKIESI